MLVDIREESADDLNAYASVAGSGTFVSRPIIVVAVWALR
jgi:hypothetical protein